MFKMCSKCKTSKQDTEFHFRPEGNHLRSHCKDCAREDGRAWGMKNRAKRTAYSRKWREENRAKHNWNHRAYAHGFVISWEQLQQKYVEQKGCCAICGKHKPLTGRDCLCADHDHKTKKYRGLLCTKCNQFIGMAHEDISTLTSAITYLQQWCN